MVTYVCKGREWNNGDNYTSWEMLKMQGNLTLEFKFLLSKATHMISSIKTLFSPKESYEECNAECQVLCILKCLILCSSGIMNFNFLFLFQDRKNMWKTDTCV